MTGRYIDSIVKIMKNKIKFSFTVKWQTTAYITAVDQSLHQIGKHYNITDNSVMPAINKKA